MRGVAALDVVVAWAWGSSSIVYTTPWRCLRVVPRALRRDFRGSRLTSPAAARLLGNRGSHGPTDRQLQIEVLAEIRQFDDIWSLGLGLFGIHLLLIGWLAFTSGFVPRIIGVLVAIAGAGYLIDSLGGLLYVPSFELASHLHRRGRADGLAAGVRRAQAAQRTHYLG